jgi:nucleoid-associated protein EbfC
VVEPGFDMNQIFQAAQQMQAQLQAAQQNLADAEVTGTSGGGLVVAKVSGQGELLDLQIDPKAIDASDPAETADTIADLVLAAIRDATNSVANLQQQQLGFAEALGGIDLSGLGIPGGGPGAIPGMPSIPGLGFGGPAFDFDDENFSEDDDEDDEDEDDENDEE